MACAPRRRLALGGLLVCLVPLPACDDAKNVQLLEAKKSEILEHTRPKQEFWDQVGRKGQALKKERAAGEELAALAAKSAQARASLDPLRKQLEDARATNAKTSDALADQQAQLRKAEGEVAESEAVLASFQERQRKSATP